MTSSKLTWAVVGAAWLVRQTCALSLTPNFELFSETSFNLFLEKPVTGVESNGTVHSGMLPTGSKQAFLPFKFTLEHGRTENLDVEIQYEQKPRDLWLKQSILLNERVIKAKSILLSETSSGKIVLEVSPQLLKGGDHRATVAVSMTNKGEKFTHDFFLSVRIYANPDPLQSRVDLKSCESLSWRNTCYPNVFLNDCDGFMINPGFSSMKDVRVSLSKIVRHAETETQHSYFYFPAGSDVGTFPVYAFSGGTIRPDLRINNVTVEQGMKDISVDCGNDALYDKKENACVCRAGFGQKSKDQGCEHCEPCQSGEIISTENAGTCVCTQCEPGKYCPSQDQDPISCPIGSYCKAGSVQPQLCPVDEYADEENQEECKKCKDLNATSSTFGRVGSNSSVYCTVCPPNAECSDTVMYDSSQSCPTENLPYVSAAQAGATLHGNNTNALLYVSFPAPGFFRFPPLSEAGTAIDDSCSSTEFLPCPGGATRCPGGFDNRTTGSCAEGYDGFLCGSCSPGYAFSDSRCVQCLSTRPYIYASLAFVAILGLTGVLTGNVIRKSHHRFAKLRRRFQSDASMSSSSSMESSRSNVSIQDPTQSRPTTPRKGSRGSLSELDMRMILAPHIEDTVVSILKIAYSHVQVIALLLTLDVNWHKSVTIVEKFASVFSLTTTDVTSSVMCLFSAKIEDNTPAFYGKVLFIFLLPFAAAVLFAIIWIFIKLTKAFPLGPGMLYYDGFELTMIIFLFLLHILLVRTALELFVCTSPSIQGRSFLAVEPEIECFEGSHTIWFILAGFGGLFFYGLGIPILSAKLVRKQRNCYLEIFLCKNFVKAFRWWESVVAARKVLLTIFIITLENYGPVVQGVACLVTLFSALSLQVANQPFVFPFLNDLETYGMITAIVTLVLALYTRELKYVKDDENVQIGLNLAILTFNVVFLGLILYELLAVSCHVVSKGKLVQAGTRHIATEKSFRSLDTASYTTRSSIDQRNTGIFEEAAILNMAKTFLKSPRSPKSPKSPKSPRSQTNHVRSKSDSQAPTMMHRPSFSFDAANVSPPPSPESLGGGSHQRKPSQPLSPRSKTETESDSGTPTTPTITTADASPTTPQTAEGKKTPSQQGTTQSLSPLINIGTEPESGTPTSPKTTTTIDATPTSPRTAEVEEKHLSQSSAPHLVVEVPSNVPPQSVDVEDPPLSPATASSAETVHSDDPHTPVQVGFF